ncbi:ABC transporter ATP-binding protein [Saccharopolyspora sp. NFXS83]|uniref:ABC transporter ATP-binding protein n=1 Tax=Saccharopolyspora sp. NFXS83 TaxID=2993560 RepID=UPI00224AD454|nr:ABC transporter ATP-binding protein [Saccharopolyspora sp. NFXS83]MCX2734382.1 ABC transporter ATP-binding protein [Saccharopolyspora sp. NFXS83]
MSFDSEQPALHADRVSKRFRGAWALRDATFALPRGSVTALVGANGAGKSTLLSIAAGLMPPSEGRMLILGGPVHRRMHPAAAFLAQHKPLYDAFTVGEHLRLGRELNERWNQRTAHDLLDRHRISLDVRAGVLSTGQRAQVGLALALAREPDVLLLDEPAAALDPLARDDLHRTLMAEVAQRGTTVLLSSHQLHDLQDLCDRLVLLDRGSVRLEGDIDELLDEHRFLIGSAADEVPLPAGALVHERRAERQATLLMRDGGPPPDGWAAEMPTLESLVLGYLNSGRDRAEGDLAEAGGGRR